MTVHTRVVEKTCRSMGFVLMVAVLSLGAISGCSNSNDDNDWFGAGDSDGSDGGLGVVDPDAGIYPNIQVIQPFLSGAIDPIKVQYWDQTYYWGPDSDGNDACFKGTVGIEDSSNLAQETAPGPECPTSLGQVTPCNPAAAADTVASGAVQPAISGCEHDGAACTDILVPDITDEVTCESTVRQADPIAAGAAWFQNIDAPGTKGGTASHWWYGTRADKTFDAEDGYGGTQIDYISDATNINIAASGGGSGPTTRVNNIYLCSNKDVVNPAESPDVCTLSSLFGSCGYAANGDPGACKINNIGLVDGAYNVFIRSALAGGGFGDEAMAKVSVGILTDVPSASVVSSLKLFDELLSSKNSDLLPTSIALPVVSGALPHQCQAKACSLQVTQLQAKGVKFAFADVQLMGTTPPTVATLTATAKGYGLTIADVQAYILQGNKANFESYKGLTSTIKLGFMNESTKFNVSCKEPKSANCTDPMWKNSDPSWVIAALYTDGYIKGQSALITQTADCYCNSDPAKVAASLDYNYKAQCADDQSCGMPLALSFEECKDQPGQIEPLLGYSGTGRSPLSDSPENLRAFLAAVEKASSTSIVYYRLEFALLRIAGNATPVETGCKVGKPIKEHFRSCREVDATCPNLFEPNIASPNPLSPPNQAI